MNTFSDILTRIPFLSIRLKVHIPQHLVIEHLEKVIAEQEPINSDTQDFFFNADFENNTFLIQTAYIKRFKGKVLVPDRKISYWRAYDPVSMDQVPIFHGIILADDYGNEAVVKGHFGIGTPFYLTLVAIFLIFLVIFMAVDTQWIILLVALFLFRAVISVYGFLNERKRIKEFLLSVFQHVIFADAPYR